MFQIQTGTSFSKLLFTLEGEFVRLVWSSVKLSWLCSKSKLEKVGFFFFLKGEKKNQRARESISLTQPFLWPSRFGAFEQSDDEVGEVRWTPQLDVFQIGAGTLTCQVFRLEREKMWCVLWISDLLKLVLELMGFFFSLVFFLFFTPHFRLRSSSETGKFKVWFSD